MKKKNCIAFDNELKCKNDKYLDEKIKYVFDTYKENPKDMKKTTDALTDVFKVLEYRDIILAEELFYMPNSKEEAEILNKKKDTIDITLDGEVINNKNMKYEPLFLETRKKDGTKTSVLAVFSSKDKMEILEQCGIVKLSLVKLRDIYEKYVLNDEEVSGIVLNPLIDNIQITNDVYNFIVNGCKEELLDNYFNR